MSCSRGTLPMGHLRLCRQSVDLKRPAQISFGAGIRFERFPSLRAAGTTHHHDTRRFHALESLPVAF